MEKKEKDIIFQLLEKEPRGLTVKEISRLGKMNRFTATIYVHELLGEGKITERKIGAYRLIYLKEKYLETIKETDVIKKIKEKIG